MKSVLKVESMLNVVKICAALWLIIIWRLELATSVACAGCVDLDEVSFNKTIRRFPYAIVKLDIAFPFGDHHSAYAAFCMAVHSTTEDLLVATVGIKDYGEMENQALGLKFGFHDKNLPGILLFKQGNIEQPVTYPSYLDVTVAHLKKFINENTELYIGCDGCLKEFNVAIKGYAKMPEERQLQVLAELEEMLAKLQEMSDINNAKIYVLYARKINAGSSDFVDLETKRLVRLRAGRVTQEKKAEIQRKLNILDQFRIGNVEQNSGHKNEL